MFNIFKKRNYSESLLDSWSRKGETPKLIKALKQANAASKVRVIKYMEPHNYMNVKRALFHVLDDSNKEVALTACQVIENMGANPDEQEKIQKVRNKWMNEA